MEWRHKHNIGERIEMTAIASYWSDSEVTRDFRDDLYDDNQIPDTFAEAAYLGDNFVGSIFGRFRPNDFDLVQERLPEVRFDLLPIPILETGAYHQASASYVQLREDFDQNAPFPLEGESDRFDLTYRLERPIHLRPWLTFTLVGGRLTNTRTSRSTQSVLGSTLIDDTFTRELLEAGLISSYARIEPMRRSTGTWDIDGLRHTVRPVIRYRYFSDPDDLGEIATIDRAIFDLERPVLDLSDLRNVDRNFRNTPRTDWFRESLSNSG